MILFVSDLHLGRTDDATAERACEEALIDCLRTHETAAEALYLVGDVFDAYIEYRHLIPKGFARLQGLLAEWTDRGVPVTYLVGNHDPWHRDYFEKELGVRIVHSALTTELVGRRVQLAHGDAPASALRTGRDWLRTLLRHPVPTALYRNLLPADVGLRLAQWVSRRREEIVDPQKRIALRAHARRMLRSTPADLVVMGHTHRPEICPWPEGTYLNLGAWRGGRTFGRLDSRGAALLRWNGTRAVAISGKGERASG